MASKDEVSAEGLGWLAATKNVDVHLEAMEETKDQVTESAEAGNTGKVCLDDGDDASWILFYSLYDIDMKSHVKRKTRASGIL